MDSLREIVISLFAVDSIWSVVTRGVLWLVISVVIIISTDTARVEDSSLALKKNLGFLLMFLVLSGGLIYLLFGYTTAQAAT